MPTKKSSRKNKMDYSGAGVSYAALDPAKQLAQRAAKATGKYVREIPDTRGESAYVWRQGPVLMASVVEGLGTKNLVADAMEKLTKTTQYDCIGYDTVATILNDLISVGARPLTIHAYWAVGNSNWFKNLPRAQALIRGWKQACNDAHVSWGGGETPTLKDIVGPEAIDLGGSAVGVIKKKNQLVIETKLKAGDRILLLKSSGINANGMTLARAIAKKLPEGYATPLPSGKTYGAALLTKTHIYAKLVQDLLAAGLDIHYISNITGHGLRKIMRARGSFTYVIEKLFPAQEVFHFMQQQTGLNDEAMYGTFNMGQDYAIFLPAKDMRRALMIVKKNRFAGLDAGYIKPGPRQVMLTEKNVTFRGATLDLR